MRHRRDPNAPGIVLRRRRSGAAAGVLGGGGRPDEPGHPSSGNREAPGGGRAGCGGARAADARARPSGGWGLTEQRPAGAGAVRAGDPELAR